MLMQWFTAHELAEMKLPGLPRRKRDLNRLADDERWSVAVDDSGVPLARKRAGARGGAREYHVSLLPAAARKAMAHSAGDGIAPDATDASDAADVNGTDAASRWHWLARQSEAVRVEAKRRASILSRVDLFEQSGMTRSAAVSAVAEAEAISGGTVWNWLRLVAGVAPAERLPHLAPRRQGGGIEADVDPALWQTLLSDYLRLSQPSWTTCYRRIAEKAQAERLPLPHSRTLWRKFLKEVPDQVIVLRRQGPDALRGMLPAQIRSVADLHAMELVNIDGHRCDVFVRMPDGRIIRPTMIAIQDVYSRKFLAWRYAETEDMVTARLVFADLFAKWGIPKGLLADNGRAFASKWLTGGAKTRFRFTVRDEDPTGLLVALGIQIHWAKPYRGQSKPIERGFRDFCDAIARHPEFDGAYTGNRPDAKPDNYGSKAIDFDTFKQVWDAGVAAHNRQIGRRSEMAAARRARKRSFVAVMSAGMTGDVAPADVIVADTLLGDALPGIDQPPPLSPIDALVPGGVPAAGIDPLADGILMQHQKDWIADRSDLKLAEKGRRTGVTFAEALDSTLEAAKSKSDGGDSTYYIGDTKDKGLEFVSTCARFARSVAKELLSVDEFLFDDVQPDGSSKQIAAYRIRFASGNAIVALSSNPANIRGLQGRVVIDEAAFHRNVAAVIDACNALLIWGGVIRIISTHNGVLNAFNELIKETRQGQYEYSIHKISFDDAVANGLYERVCLMRGWVPSVEAKAKWYRKIRKSYGSRVEAMREELDVIPREGDGVLLPLAWIEACSTAEYKVARWEPPFPGFVDMPEAARRGEMLMWMTRELLPIIVRYHNQGLTWHLGGDFAMRQDRSAYPIGYVGQDLKRHVPLIVELRACPYDQQKQALFWLVERLCGVHIERLPWERLIGRYDRPGALFYLDPPYHGCEDDYGKGVFSRTDFARLSTLLEGIEGRFILSINDSPDIREAFGQFAFAEVDVNYTISGPATPARELIIRGGRAL